MPTRRGRDRGLPIAGGNGALACATTRSTLAGVRKVEERDGQEEDGTVRLDGGQPKAFLDYAKEGIYMCSRIEEKRRRMERERDLQKLGRGCRSLALSLMNTIG